MRKPYRRPLTRLFALGLLAASGCGRGRERPAAETLFTDSSGIAISYTDLSDLESVARCPALPAPDLRVDAEDEPSGAQLYRVEGALMLRDGSLAILNRGSSEILIADRSTGSFARVGREGEGPGEFRDPIEIHPFRGDSSLVWDWALNRVSVLGPDGQYARAFTPTPAMPNATGHFAVIGSGESVVIAFRQVTIAEGTAFVPQTILLLRYSSDGALEDTVGVFPYGRAGIIDLERRLLGSPLFQAQTTFTADGRSLYVAMGSDPEVRVLDESLRLVRVIRWQPPDRSVSDADVDAFRAERLAGVSEALLPLMRLRYEAVPVADEFPAVATVMASDSTALWIRTFQRPRSGEQTWLGYQNGGAFRCVLELPRSLRVLFIGEDYLLAVETDELGAESVIRLRIEDAAAPAARANPGDAAGESLPARSSLPAAGG